MSHYLASFNTILLMNYSEHALGTMEGSDRLVLASWLTSRPLVTLSRDPRAYSSHTTQLVTHFTWHNPRDYSCYFRRKNLYTRTTIKIVLLDQVSLDEYN